MLYKGHFVFYHNTSVTIIRLKFQHFLIYYICVLPSIGGVAENPLRISCTYVSPFMFPYFIVHSPCRIFTKMAQHTTYLMRPIVHGLYHHCMEPLLQRRYHLLFNLVCWIPHFCIHLSPLSQRWRSATTKLIIFLDNYVIKSGRL